MNSFLARFSIASRKHVAENDLLAFMDGEIRAGTARRIRQHLEACRGCRSRYEEMQRTTFQFMHCRKAIAAHCMPPSPEGRARFVASLDKLVERNPISRSERLMNRARLKIAPIMNPLFASCLVALAAVLALFLVWRSPPTVAASEILRRSEMSEAHTTGSHGHVVVYQKVRIRTQTTTLERTVYSDSENRRLARATHFDPSEIDVKRRLEVAGIDWQHPLSASDFRRWHDSLRDGKDEVNMGKGVVTLLTSTSSSDVAEADLTVRLGDFHATGRRVVFRHLGTIEISELNYELLSWNATNTSLLFEPDIPSLPVTHSAPDQQAFGRPKVRPTVGDLDEAELRARLTLNQANADSGEQIVVTQSAASVQVTGVVETNARKQELRNLLRDIPLVDTSLQSIEEMTPTAKGPNPSKARAHEYSAAYQSPLQLYLAQTSATGQQVSDASRAILEASLTLQKESRALNFLNNRFSAHERNRLTSEGRALLKKLLGRHMENLTNGIAQERSLIDAWVSPMPRQSRGATLGDAYEALTREAAINKELCDEVLATSKEPQRSADRILLEMRRSLDRLAILVTNLDHISADVNP